jgi:hypothetical protein
VYLREPSIAVPRDERLRRAIRTLDGMSNVGPLIQPNRTPTAARRLVEDRLATKKGLGQG